MRLSRMIGLLGFLLVLAGCGLVVQGPPAETQMCKGWWQWEEFALEGASVGRQGVEKEGLSRADCRAARKQALAAWKELYRFEPHSASRCECNDSPPPKQPNIEGIREAHERHVRLWQSINSTLYAYSDQINDDFHVQVRSVADLGGFPLIVKRHEGPRYRVADYVFAMEEIYEETKQIDSALRDLPDKPLRHVDTVVERLLATLGRLEKREAAVERQFKEYYAVKKFWFGVDEDGVLWGPFQGETAVRGGTGQRLRFVWYLYRPEEQKVFLFFESKERCEAGRSFWHGARCGEAPTTDLESDALRRGSRVDFKRSVYDKYRLP